jgi:hypothetical protein
LHFKVLTKCDTVCGTAGADGVDGARSAKLPRTHLEDTAEGIRRCRRVGSSVFLTNRMHRANRTE